jgi:hypothetical protein
LRLIKKVLQYLATAVLGFLIGGLSLYIRSVRSGPPLEAWHQVELQEEFSLDRADEIESFEDYLSLEERLFAELEGAGRICGVEATLRFDSRNGPRSCSRMLHRPTARAYSATL